MFLTKAALAPWSFVEAHLLLFLRRLLALGATDDLMDDDCLCTCSDGVPGRIPWVVGILLDVRDLFWYMPCRVLMVGVQERPIGTWPYSSGLPVQKSAGLPNFGISRCHTNLATFFSSLLKLISVSLPPHLVPPAPISSSCRR